MFYPRRRTGAHNVYWERFPGRIGPGQAWTGCWRKLIPLAWQSVRKAVAVRDHFVGPNFGKHRTCGWLHLQSWKWFVSLQKIRRKLKRRIAKHDLRRKIHKRLSGLLSVDRWRHLIFQRCFKINYEALLVMKRRWFVSNLVAIWSILLKSQAVKQSGPVFWPNL